MNKYYIKVENGKVIEIRIDYNVDWTKEGFIEIEYNPLLDLGQPLLYINGELQVDTEEIEKREKDEQLRNEYFNLMNNLQLTDHIFIKIAEGVATEEEYADTIAERAKWRERINEIQAELGIE